MISRVPPVPIFCRKGFRMIEYLGKQYVEVDWDFFAPPAHVVAPRLIGCIWLHDDRGEEAETDFIDVEAYGGGNDRAFHLHRENTSRRNKSAKHLTPHGTLRVHGYRDMWAVDIVCGENDNEAGTVLLRAGRPLAGADLMARRRSAPEGADVRIKERAPGYEKLLCNAPCKLAEGFGIRPILDGADAFKRPFRLLRPVEPVPNLLNGKRVRVTQDVDLPWRWGHPDHHAWIKDKFK
jgi:DNA-3-methyladenine glycosylase